MISNTMGPTRLEEQQGKLAPSDAFVPPTSFFEVTLTDTKHSVWCPHFHLAQPQCQLTDHNHHLIPNPISSPSNGGKWWFFFSHHQVVNTNVNTPGSGFCTNHSTHFG
eukprot:TRINITY_DN52368_c0_g1_i1.p5 TRINITY_DN52368_c0_g1~~TRINITY_DN52368_c0_g1_i1.p5  ORF type:complete len:108 (-),score=1.30 TRINITY_DN52368_c0_g1_i1:2813-3136(-)